MRGYTTSGSNATGTATKTAVTIIGSTTVRPALFDLVLGYSGTPVDQQIQWAVKRFTAAGTAGNSPTPVPLDVGDVAAVATAGNAHSAEPTYTAGAIPFQVSLNSRASFRWVAVPGYEIKAPATAANGLGVQLVSTTPATTIIGDATVSWYE